MKKAVLIVICIAPLLAILVWAYPIYARGRTCLASHQQLLTDDCLAFIAQQQPFITKVNRLVRSSQLTQLSSLIDQTKPLWPYRDYLLGHRAGGTSYLFLLQNNYELRPQGGFPGSYVVINLVDGQAKLRFGDIYTPDGQLPGHVEPPPAIQEAFLTGDFRLPNSDWSPDFPTAAETIRWFMVQGKEINPDILGTVNLDTIKQIVALTGPIDIPEYHTVVDSDNFYTLLQTKTEVGQFPGSTQKRDIIGAAGGALVAQISTLAPDKQLAIVNLLLRQLNQQNVLINSVEPGFQTAIADRGWAGQWKPAVGCGTDCLAESVGVIEANLGANKANCCVTRQTTHNVALHDSSLRHEITIDYHNSSPVENPTPPTFYGGNYINYLRFYLPQLATDVQVEATPTLPTTLPFYPAPFDSDTNTGTIRTNSTYGFTEVGFFHITRSSSDSHLKVSYSLPYSGQTRYQLHLLKQHGLDQSPQSLNLFDANSHTKLESEQIISATIADRQ